MSAVVSSVTNWQVFSGKRPTKPIAKAYRKIQAYRELKSPATTLCDNPQRELIPTRATLLPHIHKQVYPPLQVKQPNRALASTRATTIMPGAVDDTVMEDVPQVEGSEQGEEEVAPRVRIVRNPCPWARILVLGGFANMV